MNVWVVMERERYEGGEVVGVFSNPEAAQEYAFRRMRQSHQSGPWEPMEVWRVNADVVAAYRCGAEAVTIEKHKVAEEAP